MSTEVGSTIIFRRAGRGFRRARLRTFMRKLQSEMTNGRTFTCMVTDDRELRRLNRDFLGKDYATDVLSFPEEDGDDRAGDGPLGEIAVSVDRAGEQAQELGHSIEEEIEILILHGVLHLMGMDHERDRGAMGRMERRWRKTLGLPSGLIERVEKQ